MINYELSCILIVFNLVNYIIYAVEPIYPFFSENLRNYQNNIYNIETVCSGGMEEWNKYVNFSQPALFQFGSIKENKNLHRCDITIKTNEKYGLAAVVHFMNIYGPIDSTTNALNCKDYIQFSVPKQGLTGALLAGLFDKKSSKICGNRLVDKDVRLKDSTTRATSFFTSKNVLKLHFHQSKKRSSWFDNSFMVGVTAYKYEEAENSISNNECEGLFKCQGIYKRYCISPDLKCDNITNCAFNGRADDEQDCEVKVTPYNVTKIIIIGLLGIVGIALLISLLITFYRKIRDKDNCESNIPIENLQMDTHLEPTAPRLLTQHSLPGYDTVITSSDSNSEMLNTNQCPPRYQDVYPFGPPKNIEESNENQS